MSRIRDIAAILGKTEADNTTNVRLTASNESLGLDSAQVQNVGLQKFTSIDSLPISNLTSGQQAWVESNNRMYISNGTGWYNIALINLSPRFDSDLDSAQSIVDSATPLILTNTASDSDNPAAIITYSGEASDSAQYLVNITRDSSVWTFTPLSADSVYSNVAAGDLDDSDGGDFTYTMKASDGINFASKILTISYTGLAPDPASYGIYLQNVNYPINQGSSAKIGFRYVFSNQQDGELSATGITNMFNTLKDFPGDFIDRLEFADGTNIKFRMYSSTGGTEDDGRTYTVGGYNPGWTFDPTVGSPTTNASVQSDKKIQTNFYNNTATYTTDPAGDYSLTDITWGTYDGTNDWSSNTANRIVVTAIVSINGTRWDKDNVATWNGNMTFPPPNS